MPLEMSRLSREYIHVDLDTPNDLTGSQGEAAFMAAGALPEEADWNDAEVLESVGGWFLRVLVGPNSGIVVDSVDLTPGGANPVDYQMWIRVTDNPERPVRRPGVVTIQ